MPPALDRCNGSTNKVIASARQRRVQHFVAIASRYVFAMLATAGVVGAVVALRWIDRIRRSLPATLTGADSPGALTVLVTLDDILRFRGRMDVYHAAWLEDAEANPVTRIAGNRPQPHRPSEELIALAIDPNRNEPPAAAGPPDDTEQPEHTSGGFIKNAISSIFRTRGCAEPFELRADATLDAETVARLTRAWIVLGVSRLAIALPIFLGLVAVLPVDSGRLGRRLMEALLLTMAAHYVGVPAILVTLSRFVERLNRPAALPPPVR